MTILFFARRFYPLIGGVEKHVLEISKKLVKKGHKVIVITECEKNTNNQNQQSLSLSDKIEGIEIIRIKTEKKEKFKKFKIWFELVKHIKVIYSADIVHCHDIFFWYLPFRFIFLQKKVYTTFHGYEGNNLPTFKSKIMHKIAEKLSYGNVCVGDYLKKWYGTNTKFVTYGAVDLALIQQNQSIKKIKKTKNKIIFIGRLEKETGIINYLKTLTILKNKGINLGMDVFGEGSLKNKAVLYSKQHGLMVNYKGVIKSTESVLNNYEYVFCSRYLGVLESMAAKKSVFVEYNNEIKKDCFELSPFKNDIFLEKESISLADDLVFAINNPKLSREKIQNGYNWVKKQTWDSLTDKYLKLWDLKL